MTFSFSPPLSAASVALNSPKQFPHGGKFPLTKKIRAEIADPSVFQVIAETTLVVNTNYGQHSIPCPTCSGTGFFITDDGYAITATHVIDSHKTAKKCIEQEKKRLAKKRITIFNDKPKKISKITIIASDGRTCEAEIIASDSFERTDLTILRARLKNGEKTKPLFLSRSTYLSGEPVTIIGNPNGTNSVIIFGRIPLQRFYTGKFLVVVASINFGNSGGPAITLKDFQVVGMVDQIVEDDDPTKIIAYAIPSGEIIRFLKRHLPNRNF